MPTQDFPGSSDIWFPVAPGITSIGAVSLAKTPVYVTDVNGDQVLDGNGNPIVLYYNLTVDKLVPVWNQATSLQGRLVVGASVESLPYALNNQATITAVLKVGAVVRRLLQVSPPAVGVTVAALAPTISTGARIAVPAAGVTVAAAVPALSAGAAIQVPALAVTTTGLVPDYAGRQRTLVAVPAAAASTAALPPQIITGTAVLVPSASVTATGQDPQEAGIEKSNYWSAWSQQVYGYDRDWSVDWWAD